MVSKQEAYATLELKAGALPKEVEKKYKQLALEWHPQKHNYSALSNQKFKEISKAYITLTKPKEKKHEDMSMTEMLDLFEKAFFGDESIFSKHDMDSSDDFLEIDDDDDDDYSDDSDCSVSDLVSNNISEIVGVLAAEAKSKKESAQKANQNAAELIAEEEKEKRKAAKRKAKKKRRKLKKQLEKNSGLKVQNEDDVKASPIRFNETNASASEVEEEGLDPNSAFVAVAVSKSKVAAQLQQKKELKHNSSDGNEVSVQDIHPQVLQSRELAIRGNMMANIGEFQSAIGLFTDAIKLDPTEFKYFCNRSYCYHQLRHYDRAMKDAEKAITLQPTWPKGYFRKGQAQTGLQRFAEAEVSFRKVLSLDKNCNEAIQELKRTQTCQLMEMGFSQHQAEQALEEHVNLQEATEALLSGAYPPLISKCNSTNGHNQHQSLHQESEDDGDEIYMSDEEDGFVFRTSLCQTFNSMSAGGGGGATSAATSVPALRTIAHLPAPTRSQIAASTKAGKSDFKMDSRNPEGRTSLWVGNVRAQVTEKMLMNLFAKYGELCSIRMLPDRRCAFINYKDRTSAGKAMESLQGYECCGENLLIRFPDKTHTFGQAFVMKKKGSTTPSTSEKLEVKEKLKGPVAGDECYFWRTTGCHYGTNCHYRHVKEHRGIDNKFK